MEEFVVAAKRAFESPEQEGVVKQAQRSFLSQMFHMPIALHDPSINEPVPLFLTDQGQHFLPLFTTSERLDAWAGADRREMDVLHILGKDVVKGCGERTVICVDIGETHFKSFLPDEIRQLKQVVLKLERIIKPKG